MRPLILAASWLAALLALAAGLPALLLAVGCLAVAVSLAAYRDRRGAFLAIAALGVVGLAWLRWDAATAPPPAESVAWWADGDRRALSGRVASRPEVRGATQRFTVDVREIEGDAGPQAASGAVQVRLAASREVRAGDLVRLDGRLEQPPQLDGFDYRAYLARRGVFAVMDYPRLRATGHERAARPWSWLEALHNRAHTALWDALPAAEAALAEGILLGRRGDIPRDVEEDFSRAGVTHLVVISGYNIALVGGLVVAATGGLLGRRRAGALALATIAAYCAFVGFSPPVARAAVMGGFAVLAMLSGRPYGAGTTLVIAGALLTLQDPRILQDLYPRTQSRWTVG